MVGDQEILTVQKERNCLIWDSRKQRVYKTISDAYRGGPCQVFLVLGKVIQLLVSLFDGIFLVEHNKNKTFMNRLNVWCSHIIPSYHSLMK